MKILALSPAHTRFSPTFLAWAGKRGHKVDHYGFEGEGWPEASASHDALFLLGCPVTESRGILPAAGKRLVDLVRCFLGCDKKVMGVAAGASLLAEALGAPPARPSKPELGWFPVWPAKEGRSAALFPGGNDRGFMAFHWHDREIVAPAGASILASTPACANQAFALGWLALGIQFHFDCQLECLAELAGQWPPARVRSATVQAPETILAGRHHLRAMQRFFFGVFDRFFF